MPKEQQACEQEQRSLCQQLVALCVCDCMRVVKGWGLGVKALDEVRVGKLSRCPSGSERELVGSSKRLDEFRSSASGAIPLVPSKESARDGVCLQSKVTV